MVLVNPKGVRTLVWLADPPRFFEVELDANGEYVLDADGAHVRTGRVVKGMNARKLMEELQRVRRVEVDPTDGSRKEVRGRLPKNWLLDEAWEFGFTLKRDKDGKIVGTRPQDQGYRPTVKLAKAQQGMRRGRRHQIANHTNRSVTVQDTLLVTHIRWWQDRYPDIPFRPLSQDYVFTWETLYILDVPSDDAEVLILSCVGEFLDITDDDALPRPYKPILLVPGLVA